MEVPCGSKFLTIPDFFVTRWKNWPLLRGYFGSWGRTVVAVAVVERFRQGSMYGLSASRTKKVAIIESWPLVQVWLYLFVPKVLWSLNVSGTQPLLNDAEHKCCWMYLYCCDLQWCFSSFISLCAWRTGDRTLWAAEILFWKLPLVSPCIRSIKK